MSLQETIFMTQPKKKEEYVNFVIPLDEPINLYLNIEHLLSPTHRFVYFFTTSYGKHKVILWGAYDKVLNTFSFDGSCKYNIRQLNNIITTWKRQKFIFVANYVRNRMVEALGHYLERPAHIPESLYHQHKYLLAFYEGKISKEQLNEFYPRALDDIDKRIGEKYSAPLMNDLQCDILLEEELDNIRQEVNKYEEFINRCDLSYQTISPDLVEKITSIINKFYDDIKTGKYLYSSVPCPDEINCGKPSPECGVYYYGTHEDYRNERDIS